jgi:hypothetical protein
VHAGHDAAFDYAGSADIMMVESLLPVRRRAAGCGGVGWCERLLRGQLVHRHTPRRRHLPQVLLPALGGAAAVLRAVRGDLVPFLQLLLEALFWKSRAVIARTLVILHVLDSWPKVKQRRRSRAVDGSRTRLSNSSL